MDAPKLRNISIEKMHGRGSATRKRETTSKEELEPEFDLLVDRTLLEIPEATGFAERETGF